MKFQGRTHKHFAGKPCDCKGGWKVLSAWRHDAPVRSSAVMFIRRRHFILPRHATCKGKCSGLLKLESERLGRFWAKPRRCIFLFYLLPCLSLAIVLHVRIIRASHRQPVTATYTHTSWGVMDPDTSWRHSRHSIAWEVIAWHDSLRTEARNGANAASSVVT